MSGIQEIAPDAQPTKDVKVKPDMVNHPPHYKQHPSGVECIEITRHMGFNLGNAFKYIWRADLKNNTIEDLEKAKWYLDDEIKRRLEAKGKKEHSLKSAFLRRARNLLSRTQKFTKGGFVGKPISPDDAFVGPGIAGCPMPEVIPKEKQIGYMYMGDDQILANEDEFLQDENDGWYPVPAIWFGKVVQDFDGEYKFRRKVTS